MANTDRKQTVDIKELLLQHGREIPFIQALRLLRLLLADREGLEPDSDKAFDFIRIRPELSLNFPGTDITSIEEIESKGGNVYRITATFMGLYGSSSPLPTFYTEDLIDERREDRSITRDFLDVLNNPFYHHFFTIWEKFAIHHRLAENPHDQVYDYLFSLLGLGGENSRRSLVHSRGFLSHIGITSQAPRSASGLRSIVADMLQLDEVEIDQCVQYNAVIADEQRLYLGQRNNRLGDTAHLGSQILDILGKFRISLGPLSRTRLQSVLPDTEAYRLLGECVCFYLDQPLLWDLELQVQQEEIETTQPGKKEWGKLGWNTWLFSGQQAPAPGRVPLSGVMH